MSEGCEVISLEEYGRRAKLHRGEYIIPPALVALWAATNQGGAIDAGEPTDP